MSLGDWGSLISLVCMGVTFLIVQPLKTMLTALKEDITTLNRSVEKAYERGERTQTEVNEIRERMAKVESSVSSAHKRIDDMKG